MVPQGAALSEAFTTGLATEGPFTRVHTKVGGQSTLPSKCPTTGVAAEGLVPSVGAHMILEVRQMTKGTRAGGTGKGPFVGMDAAVNCQVSRMPGAEPLPTLAAPHATMRAPAGLAQARRTRKRHHTAPVWIQNIAQVARVANRRRLLAQLSETLHWEVCLYPESWQRDEGDYSQRQSKKELAEGERMDITG
jgi:hypothetical protein